MIETCPRCGGTALLLQIGNDIQEVTDLNSPTGNIQVPVKVEEFRCQDPGCQYEFAKIIREPAP